MTLPAIQGRALCPQRAGVPGGVLEDLVPCALRTAVLG